MSRRSLALAVSGIGLLTVLANAAAAQCPAPGAPQITLYSNLPTAKGQTYILAWQPSIGLDANGGYVVERSPDVGFLANVEQFRIATTTASLKSDVLGLLYHRVRGVQGCGTVGPASSSAPITIVDGAPVVIFTTQPPALVRTANDPSSTVQFDVRNIGGKPFAGYLSAIGTPFFTLSDSGIVLLDSGQSKTFTVEFYGNLSNTPGTYQGLLTIQSTGGAQPKAFPWALVNLTVTPTPQPGARVLTAAETLPPVVSTDFASFQATKTSADPPPVSIRVTNPRTSDLWLAAESGPDGWLVPSSGWNGTPLKPGETRTVSVESKRIQGQTGGIYPRYAFMTLRTKEGQATRVQFQDLDDTSGGPCSTRPTLPTAELTYLVPSTVTSDFVKDGRKVSFVSRLLLSNVGIDPVTADLYFTPDAGGGNPPIDGYDCSRVLRARVAVPGSDVLSLTDPLSKLFGYTPQSNISGTLEVRSEQIAQIRADSTVDSPGGSGGYYGFQLPVVKRGVGAARGRDHLLGGLVSNATYRSNVIFAETNGQSASVAFVAYGPDGTPLLSQSLALPAYAKVQVNDNEIFKGQSISAASVLATVTEGSGTVLALATIIDRVSQDASTVLSRTLPSESGAARLRTRQAATASYRFVVPSVVNGYNSKPGRGPYPYESTLTLTNGTGRDVAVQLRYDDPALGPMSAGPLTVRARSTLAYSNVLREAFGVTKDSTGPLTIEADLPLVITSRVFSWTDDGVFGDGIPVYPVSTTATTTGATRRQLLADGFEHSISLAYGARSNLILTEITGQPAQVEVRLFEKGKERSGPIGTKTYSLAAGQKLQVNDVFGQLGCGGKDRKNVLAEVVAVPGSAGSVVAIGTRIDNITADSKVLVLLPVGESQGTPTVGF